MKECITAPLYPKEREIPTTKLMAQENVCCREALTKDIKSPKTLELLKLWYSRKLANLAKKYDESRMEVLKKDAFKIEALELAKKHNIMDAFLNEDNFILKLPRTAETDTLFNQLANMHRDDIEKLSAVYNEAFLQLQCAETYEQEISILITYSILDSVGKINN